MAWMWDTFCCLFSTLSHSLSLNHTHYFPLFLPLLLPSSLFYYFSLFHTHTNTHIHTLCLSLFSSLSFFLTLFYNLPFLFPFFFLSLSSSRVKERVRGGCSIVVQFVFTKEERWEKFVWQNSYLNAKRKATYLCTEDVCFTSFISSNPKNWLPVFVKQESIIWHLVNVI